VIDDHPAVILERTYETCGGKHFERIAGRPAYHRSDLFIHSAVAESDESGGRPGTADCPVDAGLASGREVTVSCPGSDGLYFGWRFCPDPARANGERTNREVAL
jgi:hypothetical protein